MKRIITLLILIQSIIPFISAQSYKPILREENSWNVFWGACDASGIDSTFSINDSIVENKIYATLYSGNISNKLGYLEEDTIQGTLTYHETSGKSYLVFDISLAPNDIIKLNDSYDKPFELIVSDTTTINNLKHIEFEVSIQMCSVNSKFTMIESVGPNVGIHNVCKYFNYSFENYLLCNYKSMSFS